MLFTSIPGYVSLPDYVSLPNIANIDTVRDPGYVPLPKIAVYRYCQRSWLILRFLVLFILQYYSFNKCYFPWMYI